MAEGSAPQPAKSQPPPGGPPTVSFAGEIWHQIRPVIQSIAVDFVLFCCFLMFLILGFQLLKLVRLLGYSEPRIQMFEAIHFWGNWLCYVLFVLDMIFKFISLVLSGFSLILIWWKNVNCNI